METPSAADLMYTNRLRQRTRRRRAESGQSAIIAIIVLFLLLFLGAVFIALIANNLRSTRRAAGVSASGRYAEAGINYLDQQLTTSPEGADWRPVPDCLAASTGQACSLDTRDPDYFWLQPYKFDAVRREWVGGFTRINFGGQNSGNSSVPTGGRALVRVTYRPDLPSNVAITGDPAQPINKYLKLESIGRVGQIVPNDPTTFGNTEGLGLRVEQVAYKALGINEYAIQVTNKDNKPVTATLGASNVVRDRGQKREIETIIEGPIRFNTDLTFYGVNRFLLNPDRNDAIEVAGKISLNKVSEGVARTALTAADPTRVYVNVAPAVGDIGNLLPSDSPDFTTSFPPNTGVTDPTQFVPGLVRDNPRGNETQGLVQADTGNQNLRAVSRNQPPLIDAAIGPNGLTRYRALTRDSAPLAPRFVAANNVNDPTSGLGPYAGQYGWGQGLYLANNNHIQAQSEAIPGGRSLRNEWLNPDPANTSGNATGNWSGDLKYEPPAVTIILTPRYMILRRAADDARLGVRGFAFRQPVTGAGFQAGRRLPANEIIRYTGVAGSGAPQAGFTNQVVPFEGYPAEAPDTRAGSNHQSSYSGDFVIYAEGNIRIRGVVGGYDAETDAFFQRHLTVVSGGGNIYVDGNLLRDNIANGDTRAGALEVKGRSTIALLAKNSVVVNTTQFLSPGEAVTRNEIEGNTQSPIARILNQQQQEVAFHLSFGPEDGNNTTPRYLTGGAAAQFPNAPGLFLRHGTDTGSQDPRVYLHVTLNENREPTTLPNNTQVVNYNYLDFGAYAAQYADPNATNGFATDPFTLLLRAANVDPQSIEQTSAPSLNDHLFPLSTAYLFGGGQQYPYANAASLIGTDNLLRVVYDPAHFTGPSTTNYLNTRLGVAPLDIRIEALMYAQEGTFFIIPGPWFNPDPNDSYERFVAGEPNSGSSGRRAGENTIIDSSLTANANTPARISHFWPFYQEPMDVRITFFGAITQNLPAEIGDQGAWMERWGWVPDNYGSTGLQTDPNYPAQPVGFDETPARTVHGRLGGLNYLPDAKLKGAAGQGGNGIVYQFDDRAISPYILQANTNTYLPLRPNPYFADQPLPLVPRLPVAPGLLYYGQTTDLPR
jgi:hypothetical protein